MWPSWSLSVVDMRLRASCAALCQTETEAHGAFTNTHTNQLRAAREATSSSFLALGGHHNNTHIVST